jgi:hypothetical protein
MPDYRIGLNYADTLIELSVKGKYLKINGITFIANRNLSNYFANMKTH